MPRNPAPSSDRLATYRAKRSAERTPEPVGAVTPEGEGRLFVVHKHAATRLHYDLRLEMGGVLESWAVPKGPSSDPQDKRLAVKVEAHPMEYGDFEGIIPEGNYGAGAVILWDRGEWVALEDPDEGMEKGKLLFDLKGYKLRGRWTLVKLKKGQNEWLLIKERDTLATSDGSSFPEGSVLSGLTVEELRDGHDRATRVRERLQRLKAKRKEVRARSVELMLAERRDEPFSKSGWVHEIKYDGYRILAERHEGKALLLTRNGHDATGTFPEVARAVEALPYPHVVLDGEVVVHDAQGLPSFQRLQKRGRLSNPLEIRQAAVALPATFYAFDLLGFEEYDLRALPLLERKAMLKDMLPAAGALKFSDHVEGDGVAFYEQVEKLGLEGMVAKQADSKYRGGRSAQWIKIRGEKTDDFVVVGFTEPKGSRGGFGALHLAAYDGERLVYTGRAGSGFKASELGPLREALETGRRQTPPCERAPSGDGHFWIEPRVVAEVRYKEFTEEGLLRQPVFVRFRDDKEPKECVLDAGRGALAAGLGDEPLRPASAQRPVVQFTNTDKIFWPDESYTKGDLLSYYEAVAPYMLPYLADRPLVMTRYPDGIDGKSFYQKDAPGFAPDWVRTVTVWSDSSERELDYFVADNAESLLYIVNLGTIPIHVWGSRVSSLELPDWCIIDLDPKEAPFTAVVEVAKVLHALCEDIGLPNYVKTSGSTGLHVLIPLARQVTYEQCRTLANLLAKVVVAEVPELATLERVITARDDKVYLDWLQNRRGQLIVAPYCVRPLPHAPVSAPLEWREVNKRLRIEKHTVRSVPKRLAKLKRDPMAGLLEDKPDLLGALAMLQERLQ
jgi:bifunctional non-homologous end joining protein LigD